MHRAVMINVWRSNLRYSCSRISSHRHLKLAHQFECFVALGDFLHREIAQTLQTKCLHAKTGKHASVNHRFAEIVEVHLLHCAGEISSHAAGKCVPCPGRIVNVFKRVSATTEELISAAKKQCAVLTLFYRDILGPHLSDAASGLDETGLLRYFARFAVVQDKKVYALKKRIQIRSRCLDPKVHRVGHDEPRALHLDRKSTRLNSSHVSISYAVFCLKKKKQ